MKYVTVFDHALIRDTEHAQVEAILFIACNILGDEYIELLKKRHGNICAISDNVEKETK